MHFLDYLVPFLFRFGFGINIPAYGLVATIIALIAITSSVYGKKISNNLPLPVSNFYQAIGGCLFHVCRSYFVCRTIYKFFYSFFSSYGHQIFLVSFGAFTILMFLIKNSANKTVSIFSPIPAVSAFMGWFFLGEILTKIDILGFNCYSWCLYCY